MKICFPKNAFGSKDIKNAVNYLTNSYFLTTITEFTENFFRNNSHRITNLHLIASVLPFISLFPQQTIQHPNRSCLSLCEALVLSAFLVKLQYVVKSHATSSYLRFKVLTKVLVFPTASQIYLNILLRGWFLNL